MHICDCELSIEMTQTTANQICALWHSRKYRKEGELMRIRFPNCEFVNHSRITTYTLIVIHKFVVICDDLRIVYSWLKEKETEFGDYIGDFVWFLFVMLGIPLTFFIITRRRIIGWDPDSHQNVAGNALFIFPLKTENWYFLTKSL